MAQAYRLFGLVREDCYDTLFVKQQYLDVACIKLVISRILSCPSSHPDAAGRV